MGTPQRAGVELGIGQRLRIRTIAGGALGLGTHLWNGTVLLDKGTKVGLDLCRYALIPPSPTPPFSVTLTTAARAFRRESHRLFNVGLALGPGRATIEEVTTSYWNHGVYVAGRFTEARGDAFWLLMSELDLPDEQAPRLRLVR